LLDRECAETARDVTGFVRAPPQRRRPRGLGRSADNASRHHRLPVSSAQRGPSSRLGPVHPTVPGRVGANRPICGSGQGSTRPA